MKRRVLYGAWMVVVLIAAAALRTAELGNRPMHCDEAVHAIKFGRLLEQADYVYDPREYHGPSLNFLTLPIARLAGLDTLAETSEVHLRLLPAIFGTLLAGLVWLVRREMGAAAAACAAALTACSAAMVFYSRYYIQETLLVCFSFAAVAALWRFAREVGGGSTEGSTGGFGLRRRGVLCLVLLGLCIGMMHASKETCVISLFAVAVALPAVSGLKRLSGGQIVVSCLIVVLTAGMVSALFFSSFGRNPRGVVDSFTTYFYYLGRASGEGVAGRHDHPWDYYLRILFCWDSGGGKTWSDLSITALELVRWSQLSIAAAALVGLAAAVLGKGLDPTHLPMARFLSVYTCAMTVVYSALPYKTPWCSLGLLHGMILLGGIGVTVLVRMAPTYGGKAVAVVLAVAAVGHLSWQAWRASFAAYEDPSNPYVYSHTTSDVPLLAQRVEEIAAAHADGKAMHIQVICPDDDYWPLPWYLRDFSRVGWYSRVAKGPAAPLIILQPELEAALAKKLFETPPPGQRPLYVPLPSEKENSGWLLRPRVPLQVYIRLDLWQAFQTGRMRQGKVPE